MSEPNPRRETAAVSRSARRSNQLGTAMVEMVIVLPVLLLLFFAIAEFGIVLGRWQTLSNAVREGARTAIVFRVGCNAATVQTEVETVVQAYASAGGVLLAPTDVTLTGACGGAGTPLTVSATYAFPFRVLPGFAPALSPSLNLAATSTMRNEGAA